MITVLIVSLTAVAAVYAIVTAVLAVNVRRAAREDDERYRQFLRAMDAVQDRKRKQ